MQPLFDGVILAEGKTKVIGQSPDDPTKVVVVSKDDITAGDGAKHDLLSGKAAFATLTTCNNFRLLKACGIPVGFDEQLSAISFSAPKCEMLPYEVVIRREAHGSYLKRTPGLSKGHLFPRLLVEFYLKTSGRKWKTHDLRCDDALMQYDAEAGTVSLFEPSKPIAGQVPFLVLPEAEVFSHAEENQFFGQMSAIARRAFLVLEKAWQLEGGRLVDCKVEFGLAADGSLLLADVIDNDSWRVLEDGAYLDKQVYRDGGELDAVAANYRRVAGITSHFRIPAQRIIIWTGSVNDDVSALEKAITKISHGCMETTRIACSVHKEPVRAIAELNRLVQEKPDTVVIAYIGRSNGAGPTLSAATTVPVITVPANFKEFPEDVWSSLRTPSNVPVTTVIEPSNAALAALEILALRNPCLAMHLRETLEERLA
ncbi:MAG: phosphoribosylaminoimidazolesuccinocarboxamide synthase [Chthoniobacteraceae bacterium]|nr:phosphoribosylaminoimidazolesuccinocarboxamide synthase [Chthoniobacteraceae bacterium]